MPTCFLQALPLTNPLQVAPQPQQNLRPLGELTCVYLFVSHQRVPQLELPITLSYESNGKRYPMRKLAYRYTMTGEVCPFDIYTLPALLSLGSLSADLKKLALSVMAAPASSATGTAAAGAAGTAATRRTVPTLPLEVSLAGEGQSLGTVDFVLVDSDKSSTNHEDYYFKYLERWLSFFDYIISFNEVGLFASQQMVRFADINALLDQYCGSSEQPSRSRILAIAEKASAPLMRLNTKLRKNLINTRKLMPVERVNAMDGKCLEYLLRLEGNSIKEKAQKNKMRILGLTKEETYNLLENRVLKDFLVRCSQKSAQYLLDIKEQSRNKSQLSHSQVERQMKVFKQRCQDLAFKSPLESVPRQSSLPKPNFVLQKDPDYKKIWQMYLDLLHEKRDLDKNLYCQQYLFQDICDLMVNAALCSLCTDKELTASFAFEMKTISKSFVVIEREQLNGHRMRSGCNAGPFFIEGKQASYSLEVISFGSERYQKLHMLCSQTGLKAHALNAPSYLLLEPVLKLGELHQVRPSAHPIVLVPLYSMHALVGAQSDLARLENMLNKSLPRGPAPSAPPLQRITQSGMRGLKELRSRVQLFPCTIVSATQHLELECMSLSPMGLTRRALTESSLKLAAQWASQSTIERSTHPLYFVSALSVRPDDWPHSLLNLKLMISAIINDLTHSES